MDMEFSIGLVSAAVSLPTKSVLCSEDGERNTEFIFEKWTSQVEMSFANLGPIWDSTDREAPSDSNRDVLLFHR